MLLQISFSCLGRRQRREASALIAIGVTLVVPQAGVTRLPLGDAFQWAVGFAARIGDTVAGGTRLAQAEFVDNFADVRALGHKEATQLTHFVRERLAFGLEDF